MVSREDDAIKWLCHHCGFAGAMPLIERRQAVPRSPPKPILLEAPKDAEMEAAYDWLASRGITRDTGERAGIVAGYQFIDGQQRIAIGFAYRQDGRTYAVKWRATTTKGFLQTGSANTLYLSDQVEQGGPIAITEGECDCLVLRQVGVVAVSVPNGAAKSGGGRPDHHPRMATYIETGEAILTAATRVVIATDADVPGDTLAEELARRVGKAKCFRAHWPEGCKDANDVLISHGPDVLRECIANAEPWPVKGLYDSDHFAGEVDDLYTTGLSRGESTGYPDVDELYTVLPGQLCVVTGIPSMGKSSWIDQVMVNLALIRDWRFAVCSFENPPKVHIAKLCQLYLGKPFFQGVTPRMERADLAKALAWVKDHFVFLFQGDGSQSPIEDIVERMRAAVLRYGIRGAVIDPANFVDRPRDMNETDWVSDALTKIKVFCMAHDVHVWFAAHPAKIYPNEDGKYAVPGGYSISGSANWFNKADVGMTVHRPNLKDHRSEIHIWKCRFNWIGRVGNTTLLFDPPTGRYYGRVSGDEPDGWEV